MDNRQLSKLPVPPAALQHYTACSMASQSSRAEENAAVCAAILAARPMLRPRLAERFPDHADAILDALLDVPQPSLESALGN